MLRAVPLRFVCGAITRTSTSSSSRERPPQLVQAAGADSVVVCEQDEHLPIRVGRSPTLPTPLTSTRMRISIVVPTRDRPAPLARCLAALRRRSTRSSSSTTAPATAPRSPARSSRPRRAARPRAGSRPGDRAQPRRPGRRRATSSASPTTTASRSPAGREALATPAAKSGRGGRAGRCAPPGAPRRGPRLAGDRRAPDARRRSTRDGRLGFAPSCNLAVARERARAAARSTRRFPARGRRGPRLERPRGRQPAWRPSTRPTRSSSTARRSARAASSASSTATGAARRATGRRDAGRRLAGPGFYAGLVRRGFAEGPAAGALVLAAQAATAAGVAAERLRGAAPP